MRGNSILFQLYTEDLDEILRFFFTRNIRIQRLNPFRKYTRTYGLVKISRNFSLESKKRKKNWKARIMHVISYLRSSRLTTPRLISLVAVSNPLTSHYSFG